MAGIAESPAARKSRAHRIVAKLKATIPDACCSLRHRNAFELLVATIMSAQCTDERVNAVTPALFARFPSARDLARASTAELEGLIRSAGFFHAKARSLAGCARALVERHAGEVPPDPEALVSLPGVGRKTANVVLGTAFGIASGIVVDTHVARLSGRLGLSREKDPVKIERNLLSLVPRESWIEFSFLLIQHGRRTCAARAPACGKCALDRLCPSRGRTL